MTKIIFSKNKQEFFTSVEVSGHTGFGEHGSDILCSAISSIVQSGAMGIKEVLKINANIVKDDENGFILIELPKNLNNQTLEKTEILFKTMFVSLQDLQKGYSKFIELEVK